MCVIVVKPKEKEISLDVLRKCWNANGDGAGVAWKEKGSIRVRKGIMSFEEFERIFKEVYSKQKEMVFHFRLTSRGRTCPEMTHPFRLVRLPEPDPLEFVTTRPVLFHNGTILELGDWEKSDTFFLARLLSELYEHRVPIKDIAKVLSLISGNKFVLFSPQKTVLIGNFEEEEGCLFSNLYWKSEDLVRAWRWGNNRWGSNRRRGGIGWW